MSRRTQRLPRSHVESPLMMTASQLTQTDFSVRQWRSRVGAAVFITEHLIPEFDHEQSLAADEFSEGRPFAKIAEVTDALPFLSFAHEHIMNYAPAAG